DIVVLMHDGGGDRSRTLPYLASFIQQARAHGYSFVTLNQLYPQSSSLFAPTPVTLADKTALYSASAYLVWPHALVTKLFVVTIISVGVSMLINTVLAAISVRRIKYGRRRNGYEPLVSVVVPAYNEEAVLAKTVSSLLRSRYRRIEVLIVDDGSKDATWKVARKLAKRPKVRAFRKRNGGKARALNFGIKKARGDIVVGIDADTIFPPQTIGKLVRHFADPAVGAVAGAVKVGNIQNALSRWQSLDYTVGIYIERNAQTLLGAVMIVPGACGAWRKEAIKKARGYSSSTLAEDFDLTLAIHSLGYKVLQDNQALAYTEAPLTIHALFKQRFRWIFGDFQTFWKYRHLLFRRRSRWLGWYALPLAIFSIIMPLVFGPLLLAVELENLLAGNYEVLLVFLAATMGLQFLFAFIGLLIARERLRHLLVVPLTRVLYGPIRSFILYRSVLRALKGAQVGWSKLQRTNTVAYQPRSAEFSSVRASAKP
ncbi:MAG TPA: glycosyltransferase, partial [Candidatus Saccharimonadales bacterium]|nr:glycosyltransferase [Candidatus Saccharimonadales bacterium]